MKGNYGNDLGWVALDRPSEGMPPAHLRGSE